MEKDKLSCNPFFKNNKRQYESWGFCKSNLQVQGFRAKANRSQAIYWIEYSQAGS